MTLLHLTTVRPGNIIAALTIFMGVIAPSYACTNTILWKANLTGDQQVPPTKSSASATALYTFDFTREQATVTVDTTNLADVTSVELHTGYTGQATPAEFVLYTPSDGKLPTHFVKTITPTDLRPQPEAHVKNFTDFTQYASTGGVYVVICTKSNPTGEIRGQIQLNKVPQFSDTGETHDTSLHAKEQGTVTSKAPKS